MSWFCWSYKPYLRKKSSAYWVKCLASEAFYGVFQMNFQKCPVFIFCDKIGLKKHINPPTKSSNFSLVCNHLKPRMVIRKYLIIRIHGSLPRCLWCYSSLELTNKTLATYMIFKNYGKSQPHLNCIVCKVVLWLKLPLTEVKVLKYTMWLQRFWYRKPNGRSCQVFF